MDKRIKVLCAVKHICWMLINKFMNTLTLSIIERRRFKNNHGTSFTLSGVTVPITNNLYLIKVY